MAKPPRVSAKSAPVVGKAKPVTATKPPKVGAARKKGGGKSGSEGGGGYKPSSDPVPW